MISYTAAQLEQERNDPKWMVVNGVEPNIDGYLLIDTDPLEGWQGNYCTRANYIVWEYVAKYRLHNGLGYIDGRPMTSADFRAIPIDEQAGITQMKEQKADEWVEGLPPIGEVCEVAFLNTWLECKVMCMDGSAIVYSVPGAGYDSSTDPDKFRPILTPKQRTIDAAMTHNKAHHWTRREFIEELYNLGFVSMPEGDNND